MLKKRSWLILLSLIFMLAACSSDSENGGSSGKNAKGSGIYPLTGEKTKQGANDRIVAVMVNNHPSARPHAGLSKADIVYEILAEGDITRFLALYQSERPDVVGSVRSAREYYLDLAKGYDAIYVYHGAAKFVDKMIDDANIDYINGAKHDNDGELFKRESFRKAPHNSFFQFAGLDKAAKNADFDLTKDYSPLPFKQEGEKIPGSDANHIKVHYSADEAFNPAYRYNKKKNIYTRSANGEETKELNGGEPVEVANVFVIEATDEVFDDEGRRHVDLSSGGSAYLFQGGKMQAVEWKNKDGLIIPVKDGKELGFLPGKTWINVIPSEPGIGHTITVSND